MGGLHHSEQKIVNNQHDYNILDKFLQPAECLAGEEQQRLALA